MSAFAISSCHETSPGSGGARWRGAAGQGPNDAYARGALDEYVVCRADILVGGQNSVFESIEIIGMGLDSIR